MPDKSSDKSFFDVSLPYYDLMVNWEKRLAREAPLFQRVFQSVHAKSVLDCACGPGQHACLFARWGMDVAACDIAPQMVQRARHLAASRSLQIDFREASYDRLTETFGDRRFQSAICVGNSLSAARSRGQVGQAIAEMYTMLEHGGELVLQVLNVERFPPGQNVYGEPAFREHLGQGYLFLKTFRRAGTVCDLDILVLTSGATDIWTREVFRERLLVLTRDALVPMVEAAGFDKLKLYGGYDMAPFDPKTSQDLIVVARKE